MSATLNAVVRLTPRVALSLVVLALVACAATPSPAPDPLPSWNEGPAKALILDFLDRVTDPDSPDFVPVPERIATFDNDGTLWSEQPMYFQLYFALDRIPALASAHPEQDVPLAQHAVGR